MEKKASDFSFQTGINEEHDLKLNLPVSECEQLTSVEPKERLFYVLHWPKNNQDEYFFPILQCRKITQEMQNEIQYYTLLFITKVMLLSQLPEQIHFSSKALAQMT